MTRFLKFVFVRVSLVERLAVEDMSRYVKEFCSRISILQFRDSSPELCDRFLVSFSSSSDTSEHQTA